jgi:hypothetical protein
MPSYQYSIQIARNSPHLKQLITQDSPATHTLLIFTRNPLLVGWHRVDNDRCIKGGRTFALEAVCVIPLAAM